MTETEKSEPCEGIATCPDCGECFSHVGQPNIDQATDLLADEWEKDIDVSFIASSLANIAKSSSIAAMMREYFIEGAYRASQLMVKTVSSQSSSAASSDHEDTNTDPKP